MAKKEEEKKPAKPYELMGKILKQGRGEKKKEGAEERG